METLEMVTQFMWSSPLSHLKKNQINNKTKTPFLVQLGNVPPSCLVYIIDSF